MIVDDDQLAARAFARVLSPHRDTLLFSTLRSFHEWLSEDVRICALILDEVLPDGSGVESAQAIRDDPRFKHTPITIVTGEHSREVSTGAFRVRAAYLCKPVEPVDLLTLLAYALVYESTRDSPRSEAVADTLVRRWKLTGPEVDLVLRQMRGERSSQIVRARGITINTYKSCVRSILNKTNFATISLLIQHLSDGGH